MEITITRWQVRTGSFARTTRKRAGSLFWTTLPQPLRFTPRLMPRREVIRGLRGSRRKSIAADLRKYCRSVTIGYFKELLEEAFWVQWELGRGKRPALRCPVLTSVLGFPTLPR